MFDMFRFLLRDADAVPVVPFFAIITATGKLKLMGNQLAALKYCRLYIHHKPGRVTAAANAVGLVILFHYCCDFAFPLGKIELFRDFRLL